MSKELITLRADDLPLLFTVIRQLGLASSINTHLKVHGNWEGLPLGELVELWLCYLLSTGDHRLSGVEKWSEQHLELLRVLSGYANLTSYDFSDDKLGSLLDYVSETSSWDRVESDINKSLLEVYRISEKGSVPTFRLDSAPEQSYGQVVEGGLLQPGYSKHHPSLPQFKVKLCTLDNELNHFALPLCHLVVEGNRSDDELYIPILEESKRILSTHEAYREGNLFVGDSKFGSIANRAYVVAAQDYYLCPLSLVQLNQEERLQLIQASDPTTYEQVFKEVKKGEKQAQVLVAQGFEVSKELTHTQDGKPYTWTERRLFVLSESYAEAQKKSLEKRLTEATQSLEKLNQPRQGKKKLTTKEEYESSSEQILAKHKVSGLIDVQITQSQSTQMIRAYKDRPQREEVTDHFQVSCQRNEVAILAQRSSLGWQVYATNTPQEAITYQGCVWKYRHQSHIESRFDDLRNKVIPLLPVFLQKDQRIKGLVNILMMALKVCSMIEYQIAKALKEQKEELKGVYEGNPNRGTTRPSAKRVLTAFEGISISLIFVNKQLQFALMTNLEQVQVRILDLLNIDKKIYTDLAEKIEMFFSENQMSET